MYLKARIYGVLINRLLGTICTIFDQKFSLDKMKKGWQLKAAHPFSRTCPNVGWLLCFQVPTDAPEGFVAQGIASCHGINVLKGLIALLANKELLTLRRDAQTPLNWCQPIGSAPSAHQSANYGPFSHP